MAQVLTIVYVGTDAESETRQQTASNSSGTAKVQGPDTFEQAGVRIGEKQAAR
jgi:hypothetical protein